MEMKNYYCYIDTWQIYNQKVIFWVNSCLAWPFREKSEKKFFVSVINQNSVSTPIPRLAAAINRSTLGWMLTRCVLKSGLALWEGIPGPCPPNNCFYPPKREVSPPSEDCAPKETNRLGVTGVQFEAWDSQNTAYHPWIRKKELFFRRFCNKDRLFFWLHPKIHQFSLIIRGRPFFCSSTQMSRKFADFRGRRPEFAVTLRSFWDEHLFLVLAPDFEEIVWSTLSNSGK